MNWYIISGVLIIFSFFTFYLPEKIKDYLIISVISVIVSLYLFEAHLYNKIDEESQYKLLSKLKKDDKNVSIRYSPWKWLEYNTEILPFSGVSHSRTIDCNENGYYSINKSDRYGFNNPDSEWDSQQLDYLIIGDSFAYGSCVNRPNDISSVIRTLSNKSVLNLGYPANGPLIEYATLREYLIPNVKKVLWLYIEKNDLDGFNGELRNNILRKYLFDQNYTQNLKSKQDLINTMSKLGVKYKIRQYIVSQKILRFTTLVLTRQIIANSLKKKDAKKDIKKDYIQFKKVLKLTNNLVSKNNSQLYFIIVPSYHRYSDKNYDNSETTEVKKSLNKLGIPFIDLDKEFFKNVPDPLLIFANKKNAHFSIDGYKQIAKTIYRLTKN